MQTDISAVSILGLRNMNEQNVKKNKQNLREKPTCVDHWIK